MRRPEWPLLAQGKHSFVFDCGDGWLWKEARSPAQRDAIAALEALSEILDDFPSLPIRVPPMRKAPDGSGFFQLRIQGTPPDRRAAMFLAWQINQTTKQFGVRFRDLIPHNILRDAKGTFWVLDTLFAPPR